MKRILIFTVVLISALYGCSKIELEESINVKAWNPYDVCVGPIKHYTFSNIESTNVENIVFEVSLTIKGVSGNTKDQKSKLSFVGKLNAIFDIKAEEQNNELHLKVDGFIDQNINSSKITQSTINGIEYTDVITAFGYNEKLDIDQLQYAKNYGIVAFHTKKANEWYFPTKVENK